MSRFSVEEKKELLKLARETIEQYVRNGKRRYPENPAPAFTEERGVFVTLHRGGELRGCIGYPLPIKPLFEAVVDNAVSAAAEDPRFEPLSVEELSDIDIEISVLSLPEPVKGINDIKIGRDGIIISKGWNRGLLLPQVPVEQKWNLEQYLSYGCLKAGLRENEWRKGAKIETFQAEVFGEKELGR